MISLCLPILAIGNFHILPSSLPSLFIPLLFIFISPPFYFRLIYFTYPHLIPPISSALPSLSIFIHFTHLHLLSFMLIISIFPIYLQLLYVSSSSLSIFTYPSHLHLPHPLSFTLLIPIFYLHLLYSSSFPYFICIHASHLHLPHLLFSFPPSTLTLLISTFPIHLQPLYLSPSSLSIFTYSSHLHFPILSAFTLPATFALLWLKEPQTCSPICRPLLMVHSIIQGR